MKCQLHLMPHRSPHGHPVTRLPLSPGSLVVALPMTLLQERQSSEQGNLLGKAKQQIYCWCGWCSFPRADMLGTPGLAQPSKGGVLWGG